MKALHYHGLFYQFDITMQDDQIVDIDIREHTQLQVGQVYLGRLAAYDSLQAAYFVDLGLAEQGYLKTAQLSATIKSKTDYQLGDYLLVQVIAPAIAGKLARLSGQIELASQALLLVTDGQGLRISKRVNNQKLAKRWRQTLAPLVGKDCAIIVRSQAQAEALDDLIVQIKNLQAEYQTLKSAAKTQSLTGRALYCPAQAKWLSAANQAQLTHYCNLPSAIHHKCKRLTTMLAHCDISAELQGLWQRQVVTADGIALVFDSTEALTAIDVNSYQYDKSSTADLAYQINLSAMQAIFPLLKKRRIAGTVVVDLINMNSADQKRLLAWCQKGELAPEVSIKGFTKTGLLELAITRTAVPFSHYNHAKMALELALDRALYAHLASEVSAFYWDVSHDIMTLCQDNQQQINGRLADYGLSIWLNPLPLKGVYLKDSLIRNIDITQKTTKSIDLFSLMWYHLYLWSRTNRVN